MPRYLRSDDLRHTQYRAFDNNGRIRSYSDGSLSRTVEWDVSGSCQSPVRVELHARAERRKRERWLEVSEGTNLPNFLEMEVRCRRCDACLRYRAMKWRYKAMSEWRLSRRTWLATLTINPDTWFRTLTTARLACHRQGIDFDALPVQEQFSELDGLVYDDIQKWLKRLRKNSGVAVRYLCITEAHKSGVPHWHLLLSEPDQPLRYDTDLKGSWPLGFSSFKLVRDARGAGYVCKYLSKNMLARVRASKWYGVQRSETEPPPNAEVTKEREENRLP